MAESIAVSLPKARSKRRGPRPKWWKIAAALSAFCLGWLTYALLDPPLDPDDKWYDVIWWCFYTPAFVCFFRLFWWITMWKPPEDEPWPLKPPTPPDRISLPAAIFGALNWPFIGGYFVVWLLDDLLL